MIGQSVVVNQKGWTLIGYRSAQDRALIGQSKGLIIVIGSDKGTVRGLVSLKGAGMSIYCVLRVVRVLRIIRMSVKFVLRIIRMSVFSVPRMSVDCVLRII